MWTGHCCLSSTHFLHTVENRPRTNLISIYTCHVRTLFLVYLFMISRHNNPDGKNTITTAVCIPALITNEHKIKIWPQWVPTYLGGWYVGFKGSFGKVSTMEQSWRPIELLPMPLNPGMRPLPPARCLCCCSSLAMRFICSLASFSCVCHTVNTHLSKQNIQAFLKNLYCHKNNFPMPYKCSPQFWKPPIFSSNKTDLSYCYFQDFS